MTKYLEIYKCEHCGNMVEVLKGEGAPIVCCGDNMILQEEKTADTSQEKHVPFIEKTDDGYSVRIGEMQNHPMTEEHSIQWIELIVDNKVYRQTLKPGDEPVAVFKVDAEGPVTAREYCNLHGLWKAEK